MHGTSSRRVFVSEPELFQRRLFKGVHVLSVRKPFEVAASVHEQMRDAGAHGKSEYLGLAFRLAEIEEYLALVFGKREGEYVGRVRFLSIFFVHAAGERISADDER